MAANPDVAGLVSRARNVARRDLRSWLVLGAKSASYRAGLLPRLALPRSVAPAILFYHKVYPRPVGPWGEPVLGVDELERQAAFLSREYEPIKLSELISALRDGSSLPGRAVVLTFDDGYRNNRQLAAPILRHYGIPATLFIATGLVGTDRWMWAYELERMFLEYPAAVIARHADHPTVASICGMELEPRVALLACVGHLKSLPHARLVEVMTRLHDRLPVELDESNRFLSWSEVRELPGYGFDLGAHTVNHPILIRQSPEEAEREAAASAEQLGRELGQLPRMFSYPNGDTSPEVVDRVGRHFEAAVTTCPGLCAPRASLLTLPRIGAPSTTAELAFELTRWGLRCEEPPRPARNQLAPPPAGLPLSL